MKHITILTVVILSIATTSVKGQVQDQINRLMPKPLPPSPNVAALGIYGDYQVDLFTGVPKIEIPIFEVQSGSLKVPITLSYHASGVRMKDVASWVGMGWSLAAGGQISRKVNGKPDEEYYANPSSPLFPSGATVCGNYDFLKNQVIGSIDTEPDIISYSFPGKSGKFIAGQAGQAPYLIPYEPISISYPSGFAKFEIIDEQGVLHRFGTNGAGVTATEGTYTSAGSTQSSAVTSWHLMEMIAPNSDDKISFTYQNAGTASYNDISNVISFADNCSNDLPNRTCPTPTAMETSINVGITTSQLAIDEILFETGKVKFFLNSSNRNDQTGLKALDRIEVYSRNTNGTYRLLKIIKFNYSYFKNTANTTDLALKLENVQFQDATSVTVQKHKFTYFTNNFSWNNNFARDFWGFYNGQTANTNLIPPTTINYQVSPSNPTLFTATIGNANRNTNFQYLKEGTLQRIDYPTGGFSEFDFEANKYSESNVDYTVGGLRVTKITSSDGGSGPVITKTYRYGLNESGAGKRNFTPLQFNYYNEQIILDKVCFSGGSQQVGTFTYRSRTYYSNSSYDMGFQEAPVLYPYVTEYFGDAAGSNLGKTVYEYDNGSPANVGVDLVIPNSSKYFRDSFGWKNGFLTHKTTYGNSGNKLAESIITYSTFQSQNKFVGYGVSYWQTYTNQYCPSNSCLNEIGESIDQNELSMRLFTQNSGALRKNVVTEYNYQNGNTNRSVMTQTTNTYDANKLQVTQAVATRSNGDQLVNINTYPFQLLANASSTGAAQGVYLINNKKIISTPLETFSYLQNSDGSNQRVVSGQLTTYKQSFGNTNHVVPDQIFLFESNLPVAKATYNPITINGTNNGLVMNGNLKPRISLTAYDTYGNLLSVSKVNDGLASYAYGYNNSLPIAEVKNASNSEFFQQNFEDLPLTFPVNSSSAHTGSQSYSGDFTVTFSRPNGRVYLIDYWYYDVGKWIYIRKTYTGTSITLTEGSAIDDVRIYPGDAQISTYTHEPVTGVSSVTDTNGRVTYYDYDSFGRLELQRDSDKNVVKAYDYQYKIQN